MMLIVLTAWLCQARADEPGTTTGEVKDSADGDPLAIAREALDQAQGAHANTAGLRAKDRKQDEAIEDLHTRLEVAEHTLIELSQGSGSTAEIAAAKAELERLVLEAKGYADGAEGSAKKAKEEADRAKREADGAATTPDGGALSGSHSLNSAASVSRDGTDSPHGYFALGTGASWLFRQNQIVDRGGQLVPATDELSSGMIGIMLEAGYAGWGDPDYGRASIGLRGTGEYNVGGGFNVIGELALGGFVEPAHVFRLDALAGIQWEMIPVDTYPDDPYTDRRFLVGADAEIIVSHDVFGRERVGLLLVGHFMPDTTGSNAGQAALYLRGKF